MNGLRSAAGAVSWAVSTVGAAPVVAEPGAVPGGPILAARGPGEDG